MGLERRDTEINTLFSKYSGCTLPVRGNSYLTKGYIRDQGCVELYDSFRETLRQLHNDEIGLYTKSINSLRNKVIDSIKEHETYSNFDNIDVRKLRESNNVVQFPSGDIWKQDNINKLLVSIDMKQANFNVMKYTTNVFDGCDTWEDYISKFTDDNFITTSKYFRQVVFGNLNTKKIKALQTHITKDIAILLKDSYNVLSVNADEVIVEVETTDDAMNISKILLDNKYDSDNLRIECFKIIAVEQPIKFFIKDNVITKERKAYCVPKKYFGIGNAIVNKRAIADTDLFFEEDGMLHKIIL